MTPLAVAFTILAAALLFIAGVAVLALGGRAWMIAVADAHRARAHGYQADADRVLVEAGDVAQEEADKARQRQRAREAAPVGPTDDEIRETLIAERAARARDEFDTTQGNEGFTDQPPIPEVFGT